MSRPEPDDAEALVDSWLAEDSDSQTDDAFDPEILAGFIIESTEALAEAERAALLLEAAPDDREAVNAVFRALHSIKGTSSFLGLAHISTLAHEAESLLSRMRDGSLRVDSTMIDLIVRCIDTLRRWLGDVTSESTASGVDDDRALIGALRAAAALPASDPLRGAGLDSPPLAEATPYNDAAPVIAESWTRVRTDRLDRLLEAIGEIVVAQSMIARQARAASGRNPELAQIVGDAGKIVRELQDLSIGMRLVPLRSLFQKLSRLVRELGRSSGKRVELEVSGEDTEIDRSIVEALNEPLVHMIRNAVDHGVESAMERDRLGKPASARLRLSAAPAAGNIIIELSDDGRGLDMDRIRAQARARGMTVDGRSLTEGELVELIFAPAFSTAERVSELSGRGVGMDVVRRNLHALNGQIEVHSAPGAGCRFRMRLPLTLAIVEAMLVRVGREHYLLPVINIQLSFRPQATAIKTIAGRGEMVVIRDELLRIVRLHEFLGTEGAVTRPEEAVLVVLDAGERRCALLVDELVMQTQVVSKPLSPALGQVVGVSGSGILADGRVGLILDPAALVARTSGQDIPSGVDNGTGLRAVKDVQMESK